MFHIYGQGLLNASKTLSVETGENLTASHQCKEALVEKCTLCINYDGM